MTTYKIKYIADDMPKTEGLYSMMRFTDEVIVEANSKEEASNILINTNDKETLGYNIQINDIEEVL